MDKHINDLETYPDIETWILINNHTGQEHIVTLQMLHNAFGEDQSAKIMAGRSPYWSVVENYPESNALQKLF